MTEPQNSRRVFLDAARQERLERDGYVTVRLLDEAAVAETLRLYDDLKCDLTGGWHADLFSRNLEYRRLVHETVGEIFRSRTLPLLDRYRHVSSIFVVKEPVAETSRVPMHQDWTLVDNSRFVSLNVVCPLVDTNAENGWLIVVPGSHRPPSRISFAPRDELQFDGEWQAVDGCLRPLPLKAGEAIIYDGRLLHGSPANRTSQRRVAFSAAFLPAEADLRLYFRDAANPGQLEILDLPDDFFLTYQVGTRPAKAVTRGFIDHHNEPLTPDLLRAWARAAGAS